MLGGEVKGVGGERREGVRRQSGSVRQGGEGWVKGKRGRGGREGWGRTKFISI